MRKLRASKTKEQLNAEKEVADKMAQSFVDNLYKCKK